MIDRSRLPLFLTISCLLALSGCAGGDGTGPMGVNTDEGIQQSVQTYWHHDHPDKPPLNVTVSQGIVSLTGTVETGQMRVDAVRDAWQPGSVIQVVNELKVAQNTGAAMRKDEATTIRLRTRLTFDPAIQSTNYSIETVNGVVYLMGVEQSEVELDQVKKIAESIVGPEKVVSYVRPR